MMTNMIQWSIEINVCILNCQSNDIESVAIAFEKTQLNGNIILHRLVACLMGSKFSTSWSKETAFQIRTVNQ